MRRTYFREWRIHAGFSQDVIASKLKVTKPTVSRIERGERDFTGKYLFNFADICGCATPGDPISRPPWGELLIEGKQLNEIDRDFIEKRIAELADMLEKNNSTRSKR